MQNKQLLRDYRLWKSSESLILEDVDNLGDGFTKLWLKGKAQEAEALNQNERFYPMWILEREVEEFKKNFIDENRAWGELDHPDNAVVNLANVCHIIRELWWEGKTLMMRIEILNGPDPMGTPSGRIVETLIRRGGMLGVSSRGVGSTERNTDGYEVVQPDYQLITWDIVSNPSTHKAFVLKEGIMRKVSKSSRILTANEEELIKYDKVNRILHRIVKG